MAEPPHEEQDAGDAEQRPSFTTFWKRSKEALSERKITFMPSNTTEQPPTASSSIAGDSDYKDDPSMSTEEKAQARRAQVRRAQIQHRQRKANYVKQLELDIARIRDDIASTQYDTSRLRAENDAMQAVLSNAVEELSMPRDQSHASSGSAAVATAAPLAPSTYGSDPLGTVTMSLNYDETMGRPCYQISERTSPSMGSSQDTPSHSGYEFDYGYSGSDPTEMPPPRTISGSAESPSEASGMSADETQQVINFILALEHICWDHFGFHTFATTGPLATPAGKESGHSLMASSIALRTAPEALFETIKETRNNIRTAQAAVSSPKPAAIIPEPTMTMSSSIQQEQLRAATTAQPPQEQSPEVQLGQPPSRQSSPLAADISWEASGLTLQSLYGIACSINPPDLDLAPVQAWFELAAVYPISLLMRRDIMEQLKREFVGVVKCPHFGAAIERTAFESIVSRVLDPQMTPSVVSVAAS